MDSDTELMKKVQSIAGHIHQLLPTGTGIDRRDLVQDGMIGWLDAKRLLDPRKGTSLLAFAGRRISGAIRDGLRSRDQCSRSTRVRIKQIRAATWKLSQQLGRDPTSEETAAAVNLPLPALYAALSMAHAATPISLSFSLPGDADGDETIADIIADERGQDAFELVAQLEHKKLLHDAFRKLNAQERQAVWLYYLDENQYTLEEVGQFMGLGAPRISQICSGAKKKLAAELAKHQEFASRWNVANRIGSMRPVHPRQKSRLSTTGTAAESRSTTPRAPCKSVTSSGAGTRPCADAAD